MTKREEDTAARPRKKQRVGGVPSSAAATTGSTRAKFAFGSRLPDAGKSLLKGSKSSRNAKLHTLTHVRHEHDVRAPTNLRKRRRSLSRDSDETTSRTKPSHRTLTVKTALPLLNSHLPALTKVSARLVRGSHLHTISPSNPATRHKKRRSTEEQEQVADLAAAEPVFWIKRRKAAETALKELDAIGNRIMAITK